MKSWVRWEGWPARPADAFDAAVEPRRRKRVLSRVDDLRAAPRLFKHPARPPTPNDDGEPKLPVPGGAARPNAPAAVRPR
ncbi:MAG TPA: hypothetical protein VF453_05835, partial [Burkholderiaceae bacterium]